MDILYSGRTRDGHDTMPVFVLAERGGVSREVAGSKERIVELEIEISQLDVA